MLKKIALVVVSTVALGSLALSANVGCTDNTDENYCADSCKCENRDGDAACLKACRDDLNTIKSHAIQADCLDSYNEARDCVDTQSSCVSNRYVLAGGACTVELPNLTKCVQESSAAGGAGGSGSSSGSTTSTGK